MSFKFLEEFEKSISKIDGVGGSSEPPRYWYGSGNACVNRILTGSFNKCIPQGRITGLVGPSASGKSFMLGNFIRSAQQAGAICLVVDSENAFDDDFAEAIGINTNDGYIYKSVVTIAQAQKVISAFLKSYKKEYAGDPDAPQVVVALDSLDMLLTDTELDNYDKGKMKGDQGQRNKQLKAMLRTFVQDIKSINVSMIVTGQVYRNQDVLNGEGVWIVSDAVRYSLSQIILLTKLKLKDDDKSVAGIKMKVEGYKTRFTKPFQTVTVEVPYEGGMDPYSGLLEAAEKLGVVERAGSRWRFNGNSFYAKDIEQYASDILVQAEMKTTQFLDVADDAEIDSDQGEDKDTTSEKRRKRAATAAIQDDE